MKRRPSRRSTAKARKANGQSTATNSEKQPLWEGTIGKQSACEQDDYRAFAPGASGNPDFGMSLERYQRTLRILMAPISAPAKDHIEPAVALPEKLT